MFILSKEKKQGIVDVEEMVTDIYLISISTIFLKQAMFFWSVNRNLNQNTDRIRIDQSESKSESEQINRNPNQIAQPI